MVLVNPAFSASKFSWCFLPWRLTTSSSSKAPFEAASMSYWLSFWISSVYSLIYMSFLSIVVLNSIFCCVSSSYCFLFYFININTYSLSTRVPFDWFFVLGNRDLPLFFCFRLQGLKVFCYRFFLGSIIQFDLVIFEFHFQVIFDHLKIFQLTLLFRFLLLFCSHDHIVAKNL